MKNFCYEYYHAFLIALRESRNGMKDFIIFSLCLSIGIFSISAIGQTTSSILASLKSNSSSILGGDIVLSKRSQNFEPSVINWVKNNSIDFSISTEMRTMTHSLKGNKKHLITDLKVIDDKYPLYGSVKIITSNNSTVELIKDISLSKNDVIVEKQLLDSLSVNIEDKIYIGKKLYKILGILIEEPDKVSNFISIGPKVIVNNIGFKDTELNDKGSLTSHKIKVKIDNEARYQEWKNKFNEKFYSKKIRIQDASNSQQSTINFINQLNILLIFTSFIALLLGGIGVSNSVNAYIKKKTISIAILKLLGSPTSLIFRTYLILISFISFVSIIFGITAGAIVSFLSIDIIQSFFSAKIQYKIFLKPIIVSIIYGFLVAAIFSIWPISIAANLSPLILFRKIIDKNIYIPKIRYFLFVLSLTLILVGVILFNIENTIFSLWFIFITLFATIFFILLSKLIIKIVKNIFKSSNFFIKIAASNITRPDSASKLIIISYGIGITLIFSLLIIQTNLSTFINSKAPNLAPSFFFVDIQKNQINEFNDEIVNSVGLINFEKVPTMRSRLIKVSGKPIEEIVLSKSTEWIKRHDFGATYSSSKPARSQLILGKWWDEDYNGKPLISLDQDIAKSLNIFIGDTLTFNILGRDITAKVYNLRKINWSDFGINFFVIFSPGVLNNAPYNFLATASFDNQYESDAYIKITNKFPNITLIKVKDIALAAVNILNQVSAATIGITSLTILTGILVLASSVLVTQQSRIREIVIFKIIGITPKKLFFINFIEFFLLGLITSSFSLVLGIIISYLLVKHVFNIDWEFFYFPILIAYILSIISLVLIGFLSSFNYLSKRPGTVLRNL